MRIAHLSVPWNSVPPKNYGGTEVVLHNLIRAQLPQGHEVTLFAPGDSKVDCKLISFLPHERANGTTRWRQSMVLLARCANMVHHRSKLVRSRSCPGVWLMNLRKEFRTHSSRSYRCPGRVDEQAMPRLVDPEALEMIAIMTILLNVRRRARTEQSHSAQHVDFDMKRDAGALEAMMAKQTRSKSLPVLL